MAGIKNVYRSPDAFRFPTWDSALTYDVNSVVAYYNEDTTRWEYYIAKKQTEVGSLDSDIRYNDWTQFTFDSDSIRQAALQAVEDNFNALENSLANNFMHFFEMLVRDNDSDFKVLQTLWDSDWLVWKDYFDSEVKKVRLEHDSETQALRSYYNNKIYETDSDLARFKRDLALRVYTGNKVERAVRIEFDTTKKLSKVKPHPDTIAVVKSNNTVYVVKDSEWVLVNNIGVMLAVDSEKEFPQVWPPSKFPVGTRAINPTTRWEYDNNGLAWVVDESSKKDSYYLDTLTDVQTKQNSLINDHDSDLSVTNEKFAALISKNTTQDSQILQNTNTYVSLYNRQNHFESKTNTTIAGLKSTVEHSNNIVTILNNEWAHNSRGLDSDISVWKTKSTTTVNNAIAALDSQVAAAIDHFQVAADSDRLVLSLITTDAISEVADLLVNATNWRNDELARFAAADLRMDGFDSDRLADNAKFYNIAMKYRGDVVIDDDTLYPTFQEVGDVYNVVKTGIGSENWGPNIDSVEVRANSLVLYTAEKGWVIMNSGSSGQVFEDPISIDNIGVPAGSIIAFPNINAIPPSFRLCDGSGYNATIYTELFSFLGTNILPTVTGTGIVYAIAMFSGAGSTRYNYDSDVRLTVTQYDSDIKFLYKIRKDFDSDITRDKHDSKKRDSDIIEFIKRRDSEQDSDFKKLTARVNNIGAATKLVQWSKVYNVAAVGGVDAGTEYDITTEVVNTSTPELYCYPDLEFFYDNQSANAHPTLNGRRLDGENGTPRLTYRIIHDAFGNMIVGLSSSANISHDIRIVSTFRTA